MTSFAQRRTLRLRVLLVLLFVIGGSSMALFGAFLVLGPFSWFRFAESERAILAWDTALSLLFFAQHSGMIRQSVRTRLARAVGAACQPAVFAIASSIVLLAVVVFWQRSAVTLLEWPGAVRMGLLGLAVLAPAGFVWGSRALPEFDPFGARALIMHGRTSTPPVLTIAGPYRWVRHPLYFFVLVLIWSRPVITADRLLFNVIWTAWIILGTRLEERDLVATFGDSYRRYQRTVPMLLPWRGRTRAT